MSEEETKRGRNGRSGEKGNIFFTLFGAVAIIGLLGAAIMATMRGPLTTMVEVNRRAQAEAQMSVASKLVLLQAASAANNGDCDNDGFVEPLEWKDAAGAGPDGVTGSNGGGFLPDTVGSEKTDPWGTPYGYCAWDAGTKVADAACGGPGAKRLAGNGLDGAPGENYTMIAIISAGPDHIFQTKCTEGPPALTKGGDDLVSAFDYATATAAAGGLWTLKSGDPSKAQIAKDLDVTGGAKFSGAVDLSSASAQLKLGAASMILPDQTVLADAACVLANVNLLRINKTTDPDSVEICDGGPVGAGPFTWQNVAKGAAGLNLWKNDGPGAPTEIYYMAGPVGIGTNDPTNALDVTGDIGTTGNLKLSAGKSVVWASTAAITESGGNLQINANGGAGVEVTVAPDALTVAGNTVISGTTADSSAAALTVKDSAATTMMIVSNNGHVGINDASPGNTLSVGGNIDASGTYRIDNSVVLNSNSTMVDTILLGHDAGVNVTGDQNTILGALAAGTLTTGKNNIVIGQSVDVPTATTHDYLNIGNTIFSDLATKHVGIGFADKYDASTIAAMLEVNGNINASGTIHATSDVTAGGKVTAVGNVEGADLRASSQVFVDGDQLGPVAECTSSQKLSWTNGAGWSCINDLQGGSGGAGENLKEVLAIGDDANQLNGQNFQKLGANLICNADLSTCFDPAAVASGSLGAALSGITAATIANTITTNADFAQVWNWTLVTAAKSAFTFGEQAAATNGAGAQSIVKMATLASSTAMPLWISNAGNALSLRVDDSVGDATPFVIDKDGKVGIGTAAPPYSLAVEPQSTVDGVLIDRYGAGNTNGAIWALGIVNAAGTGGSSIGQSSTTYTTGGPEPWIGDDSTYIAYSNTLHIGSGVGATPFMTFDSAGNVGIGTATIADGSSGGGQALMLDVLGAIGGAYYCDENGLNCFTAADVAAGQAALSSITVATQANTLTDNGDFAQAWNWSLATAANVGMAFGEHTAAANGAGAQSVVKMSTLATSTAMPLWISNLGVANSLQVDANGGVPFVIDKDGNVGVGTATPGAPFEVHNAGNSYMGITSGSTYASLYMLPTGSGVSNIGYLNAFQIGLAGSLGGAITPYLTMDSIGNVGIGNATPGTLLDVGDATHTLGVLRLEGSTSGYVQLQPPAAAGSWTMTFPGSAGTNNYVLTTNGVGVTTWTDPATLASGGVALSGITPALAANTITTNNDFAQAWKWTLITAAKSGMEFGEQAAATNGAGAQSVVKMSTLAASTAMPLWVVNAGNANSFEVDDQAGGDATPFVITKDGNVGIGIPNPADALDVSGNIDNRTASGNIYTNRVFIADGDTTTAGLAFDADADTGLIRDSAHQMSFITGGARRLTLDASGGVGIATTTVADGSGGGGQALKLDVAGAVGATHYCDENGLNCFTAGSAGALSSITAATKDNTINSAAWNQQWNWTLTGAEAGFTFGEQMPSTGGVNNQYILKAETIAGSTAIPFLIDNAGTSRSFRVNSGATPFVIDNTGQVGIGTTSPATLLHLTKDQNWFDEILLDNPNAGTSADSGLRFKENGTDKAIIASLNSGFTLNGLPANALLLWNYANGPMVMTTNNLERMRIDASGNVGIGTATPTQKLEVDGGLFVNGEDNSFFVDASQGRLGLAKKTGLFPVIAAGSATPLQLGHWSTPGISPTEVASGTFTSDVYIDTTGKVGIGTGAATPSYLVSLNGEANDIVGMERTSAGTNGFGLTVLSGGAKSGSTDKNGGDLTLSSAVSTGNGYSSVIFKTVKPGQGTGVTDRTPAIAMTLASNALTLPGGPTTEQPGQSGMQLPTPGMIRYDTTLNKYQAYQNGAWQDIITSGAGGTVTALSSISAAIAPNVITTNNDYAQAWKWTLTTAAKSGMEFGEAAAAANGAGAQSVVKMSTLATSTAMPLWINNLGAANTFEADANGGVPFVIDHSGNVGIGTATPWATEGPNLDVSGATVPRLMAEATGGPTPGWLVMGMDSTDGPAVYWKNDADMRFATSSSNDGPGWSEKMRITHGGNLGIGTTIPSYLLSLGGDADRTIGMERMSAAGAGKDLTILAGGAHAGDTDTDGGNLILSAGTSTGNGGSDIVFNIARGAFGAGTTDRAPAEIMRIRGDESSVQFQTGVAPGFASMAWGDSNHANAGYATAWGVFSNADGDYGSTAFGAGSEAAGEGSTAWGGDYLNSLPGGEADGVASTAFGVSTVASGDYSTASGNHTTASGIASVASGYAGTASGDYSMTWNELAHATGQASTAWGTMTTASGFTSTAWGGDSTGDSTGSAPIASGNFSTAFGYEAKAGSGTAGDGKGNRSVAIGFGDTSAADNTEYPKVEGNGSFGLFMQDQKNVNVSTDSTLALLGGTMVIDPASPATHTHPATGGDQDLEFDVYGDVGAVHYCDEAGNNCFTAATAAAGGSAKLNSIIAADNTATIANGDNAINWNWTLTTAAKSAFNFGETAHATNGVGAQSVVKMSTLATSTAMPLWINNLGGANSFEIDANGGKKVVVDKDGKVGIGTATPFTKLDVRDGVANLYLNLQNTDPTYDVASVYKDGTNTYYVGLLSGTLGTSNTFAISQNGNSDKALVIDSSGNVGIDTIAPSYLLSLNGEAARTIGMEREVVADTAGNNLTIQSGGATVGATNKDGGDLILNSGIATGTGASNIFANIYNNGAQSMFMELNGEHTSAAFGDTMTLDGYAGMTWGHQNILGGGYETAGGVSLDIEGYNSIGFGRTLNVTGDYSAGYGLGDTTLGIDPSNPTVSGASSFGIFMDDQTGADISDDNTLALLGGVMVIDPASPATHFAPATGGDQDLEFDVYGDVGAVHYCDEAGNNCFTAATAAAGGSAKLNSIIAADNTATIANGDNAINWNWTLTTAAKSAFNFGETAHATNGVGAQSVVKMSTLATSTAMPLWISNLGAANSFRVDANAGVPFVIDKDGKVGIGTATPSYPLDVFMGTNQGEFAAGNLGFHTIKIGNLEDGLLGFMTHSTVRMGLSNTGGLALGPTYYGTDPGSGNMIVEGQMGIGTTTPTVQLDVAGYINAGGGVIGTRNGIITLKDATPAAPGGSGDGLSIGEAASYNWIQSYNARSLAINPLGNMVGIGAVPVAAFDVQTSVTAGSGQAYATRFQQTLTAAANNDALYGVYINPTYTPGAFTGVTDYDLAFGPGAARTIIMTRETAAAAPGNNLTLQSGGAKSGGTNLAGGDLDLSSGIATGNGASSVIFKTVKPGQGTGATDRLPVASMTLASNALTLPSGPTTEQPGQSGMQASVNGMIRYDSTVDKFQAYQAGTWQDIITSGAGGVSTALSSITDAVAAHTITANADYAQAWKWTLTTAAKSGMEFGEQAAATNGVGAQSVVKMSTLATSTAMPLWINNLGAANSLEIDANGGKKVVVDKDGNVGIGTTTPSVPLEIQTGDTGNINVLTLSNSNGGGNAVGMNFAVGGVDRADIYSYDSSFVLSTPSTSSIFFRTNSNTERLYIDGTNGNIGIATTTPSYLLSLDGQAARTIGMERDSTAATAGQNLTILAGGAKSGGTDLAGGNLNLSAGVSTGNMGSDIAFFIAQAGVGTGTTDRAPVEYGRIRGDMRSVQFVGGHADGLYSFATGYQTTASGNYGSVAFGETTEASEEAAAAWGYKSLAEEKASTAWGGDPDNDVPGGDASGVASTAFGVGTTASGDFSTAFGANTSATNDESTALGYGTAANGPRSMAWGNLTIASQGESTAFGYGTSALGVSSTAWGGVNVGAGGGPIASGDISTAFGFEVKAGSGTANDGKGDRSVAIGFGDTSAADATEYPKVEGVGSFGLFMGDQKNVNVSTDSTLALVGGKMVIDSASPATHTHPAIGGDQDLEFDVYGDVGAIHYCDESGNNCFTAATASAGGSAALSAITAATVGHTIANANFAQIWNWDTLTTQNALTLGSTSLTTGAILNVANTNATASTGSALTVSTATAGAGNAIKATQSGASNTGAAVYGVNSDTGNATNFGVYGETDSTGGSAAGVYGYNPGSNGYGVSGISHGSVGVFGYDSNGGSVGGAGLYGKTASPTSYGVYSEGALKVAPDATALANGATVDYNTGLFTAPTLTVGSTHVTGLMSSNLFTPPTLTKGSAVTVDGAATMTIAGAPVQAGSVALTNTYGLDILAGAVSTATNSYGLYANAQTGGANNYAAAFMGGNVGIANTAPGALLDIGTATSTLGTMRLEGNTSGYVQMQPAAAAGSWTMTLPGSAGTNNYVLTTNGSGVTTWTDSSTLPGGGSALSSISAATIANTITTNNDYAQAWKWTLTTAAKSGMEFGEQAAATNGAGAQSVVKMSTLATSTAMPLWIVNAGAANSFEVDDVGGGDTTPFLIDNAGQVGIATTAPAAPLQIRDTPVNISAYTYRGAAAVFKSATDNGGSSPAAAEPVLILSREGVGGQAFANFAEFDLSRNSNSSTDPNTRLDIGMNTSAPGDVPGDGVPIVSMFGTQALATTGVQDVFQIASSTQGGVSYPQVATFKLGRYTNPTSFSPNTRLDIGLKSTSDAALTGDATVMTLQADGNVGIGTTAPAAKLDIDGGSLDASAGKINAQSIIFTATNTSGITNGLYIAPTMNNDNPGVTNGIYLDMTQASTGTGPSYGLYVDGSSHIYNGIKVNNADIYAINAGADVLNIQSNGTTTQAINIGAQAMTTGGFINAQQYSSTYTGDAVHLEMASSSGVFTGNFLNLMNCGGAACSSASTKFMVTSTGATGIANASPGALLDIGKAGTTLGTMRLEGNTSGYVQMQPAAAAGSWTMTLPPDAGTNGYVLTTNGSGVTTWASSGAGSVAWSGITNPVANEALTMAHYASTFTYDATTGANNLFNLADTNGNTGTGYLMNLTTGTGSTLNPLHASVNAGTNALTVAANGSVNIGNKASATQTWTNGAYLADDGTNWYNNAGLAFNVNTNLSADLSTYGDPTSADFGAVVSQQFVNDYVHTGTNPGAVTSEVSTATVTAASTGPMQWLIGKGIHVDNNGSGDMGEITGIDLGVNNSGAGAVSGEIDGMSGFAYNDIADIGTLNGISISAENGSGDADLISGMQAEAKNDSGDATNVFGMLTSASNDSGTVDTLTGNFISVANNSGAVTNAYGLFINDTSGVASGDDFNIYSAGANSLNYFGGKVGIGTTAPTAGLHVATNGAASTPAERLDGTWFTGGSATTTKPQFLIEPAGTTSTGWNTNGTALGVNADAGFNTFGYLIDLQANGASVFNVDARGDTNVGYNLFLGSGYVSTNAARVTIGSQGTLHSSGPGAAVFNFATGDEETTTGPVAYMAIANAGVARHFNPTSGSADFSYLDVGSTDLGVASGGGVLDIDQTSTATGVTRGIYVSPTLASAYDYRALETMAYTDNLMSTSPATQKSVLFNAPTYAAGSAKTVTNAATQIITGAPIAGSNVIITNDYALWIQGGNERVDGNVGATQFCDASMANCFTAASVAAGSAALSSITAATIANTITTNNDFAQLWKWTLTTAAKSGMEFGEQAAATNGAGAQSVVKMSTLATSTAMPLWINNLGAANSFEIDANGGAKVVVDKDGNVGVGTATPKAKLDLGPWVPGLAEKLRIFYTSSTDSAGFGLDNGGTPTVYAGDFNSTGSFFIKNHGINGTSFFEFINSTSDLLLGNNQALTILGSNGNVGIGTTTPGYTLDIESPSGTANQTVFIQDATPVTGSTGVVIKAGAGQSAYLFHVLNHDGSTAMDVQYDGSRTDVNNLGVYTSLILGNGAGGNGASLQLADFNARAHTSGGGQGINIPITFAPASGTGTYVSLQDAPIVNQTGGANGVTRGIYDNPTLTSAFDYRALETAGYTENIFGTIPTTLQQVLFNAPTYAAGSAKTVTNAATQIITGAPIAGSNVTITNPYALWVQGGVTKEDGALELGGIAAPAVSPSGTGRIYFDSTSHTFKVSQNGGAYAALLGGAAAAAGSTGDIQFNTSNALDADTGKFFWDKTHHRLGINTATPGVDLDVNGLASFGTSGTAAQQILIGQNSTYPAIWMGANTSAPSLTNESILYDGAGSGTTVLNAPSGGAIHFRIANTTVGSFDSAGMLYTNGTDTGMNYTQAGLVIGGAISNTDYALRTNNSEVMRLTTGGKVGIGTTTPTAALHIAKNGAASTPAERLDGTWYSAGSTSTNLPQLLVEPTGTTSTGWSGSGTGIGVNGATGFAGNLIDAKIHGYSVFTIDKDGIEYLDNKLIVNPGRIYSNASFMALYSTGALNGAGSDAFLFTTTQDLAPTSGPTSYMALADRGNVTQFQPTSGGADFTVLNVGSANVSGSGLNINQTSTATGVTRQVYITPLVQSAYDYRALEIMAYTDNLMSTSPTTTRQSVLFNAPTLTAGSAKTVTNAATQIITGAPVAGSNVTITNPYALWIQGGVSRFDGTINVTGDINYSGVLTDTSDIRLKQDVAPLNAKDVIGRLDQINTYSYRLKADVNKRLQLGVIAQEVEKVFPELVITKNDAMGTKSVNYIGFIAPLIEASKDLKKQNDDLKTQVTDMKAQLDDLSQKVAGLEVHTGYGVSKAGFEIWQLAAILGMFGFSSVFFFLQGGRFRKRK